MQLLKITQKTKKHTGEQRARIIYGYDTKKTDQAIKAKGAYVATIQLCTKIVPKIQK